VWYYYDVIDVEVYIEVEQLGQSEPIYEVFVNFTDYTYYDYE